jgi:signal transduction histidine kinase
MLYEMGLLLTVALTGWLALDPLLSSSPRGGKWAVGALGLCGGLWAAGELLVSHAPDPDTKQLARRIFYLGACFIGVAWLWLGAQAARALSTPRARWLLAACVLPSAFFYSGLYWPDSERWFSDWSQWPRQRGPLFVANLVYTWILLGAGLLLFARAARRLGRMGSGAFVALSAGLAVPLIGNALYLDGRIGTLDPTPILVGISCLIFRVAVIDSGLAACLPLGHAAVLEQLEVGVLVADLDGEVVEANPAAYRLLGGRELVGAPLTHVHAGAEAESALEVREFPLRGVMGTVGAAALVHDRSEAQQAARRLQLAARLEAVGLLTAGIAHEVNNPLAFIRANLVQLEKLVLRLADAPGRDAHVLVEETQQGVERIVRLVERLRTFARSDASPEQRRELQLADVARRAVELARAGLAPDAIGLSVAPAPAVRASEGELVQVVLNLLVNAIHASGGAPRIEVDVRAEADGVALRVRDHGPGIPAPVLPRIFDPFFTTKPPGEGTGLGLSLSFDLVARHGGTLCAANHAQGGAELRVWLPAANPHAEA